MNLIPHQHSTLDIVYLIYDGDCWICSHSAKVLQIQKSIGKLATINAREDHPLVFEIMNKGYDLNQGIIVIYRDQIYAGVDAMHFLSMVGSPSNFINRLNVTLFKRKSVAKILYPMMKFCRNVLLWLREIPKISNARSHFFETQFALNWHKLPHVLQVRYGNRIYSNDLVKLFGKVNIQTNAYFNCIRPLIALLRGFAPKSGQDIITNVSIISHLHDDSISMQRIFQYPPSETLTFCTVFQQSNHPFLTEMFTSRLGIEMTTDVDNHVLSLLTKRYFIRLFSKKITIPLQWFIGTCEATEEAVSDTQFKMQVRFTHPLFKEILCYEGTFEVQEITAS